MHPPRILIQLDTDPSPSVFDAVVAIDSQVQNLLQYGAIDPSNVVPLVHGAMFTRAPSALHNTAIFVGGSDVQVGSAVGQAIQKTFFGPIRVSVMLDGNGSNTTAAAAVLCAARHLELSECRALVLGGTGPVGGRVATLLLRQGASVHLASRDLSRAQEACSAILANFDESAHDRLTALDTSVADDVEQQLNAATLIFGCGAAGVPLLTDEQMRFARNTKVAIDLNAVEPPGLGGIKPMDKAVLRGGRFDYGALGVGGLKMKIHRAAIHALFQRNDLFLNAEEIFHLGRALENAKMESERTV